MSFWAPVEHFLGLRNNTTAGDWFNYLFLISFDIKLCVGIKKNLIFNLLFFLCHLYFNYLFD